MRNIVLIQLTALGCLLAAASGRAEAPRQTANKLNAQLQATMDYLLYLPADYDQKSSSSWPLLIFMHGAGERGDDLNLVKKHGPPKLIDEGKEFPFIVVSPQCRKDSSWQWQLRELSALVDEIATKHKVDQSRIYLTGLSMGGFGTWALAAYSPERFAAIIPICGGGDTIATRRLAHMPTWVFHGAKDPVVPLKRSEDMVEALKRSNDEVKFTVYPEAQHDSWTATYDNPEVYEWLLRHKREPAGKSGQ
jgi:predicted peptidase